MNGISKSLIEIEGKSMILRVVDSAINSGVDPKPVIVIGKNGDSVKEIIGGRCEYIVQEKQLGTGHAVQCTENLLKGKAEAVVVLYADNPFVTSLTIKKLAEFWEKSKPSMAMLTAKITDFEGWRKPLSDFGRIVRNENGAIVKNVEKRDASLEELQIKEVNPSICCFDAPWLWENLKKINNDNSQKEYYLTDLVKIAIQGGGRCETIPVDAKEAVGINTPEQLEIARRL